MQIVGMIFQTRSNTTKSEAGIWKKFYMPASLFYRFVYSFTLLYCHRTLLCSHLAYLLNLI
ncbi:hypothetical protein [Blautia wexlerae]|uniref:hypothetical protein n=1 Tax=Blautia wexlerae TaxID=418240 RepID=UPI0027BAE030|nr:hypothetical protein [Blautia wexlerae]